MSTQRSDRPHVMSWRATPRERALVVALAESEGRTVSDVLREMVLPSIVRRLSEAAAPHRPDPAEVGR